jgi:hypothetical protein
VVRRPAALEMMNRAAARRGVPRSTATAVRAMAIVPK